MLSGCASINSSSFDYAVVDKLPLPGQTRWDYLTFDSKSKRLFIAHSDKVDVLDVTTQKIVGSISDLKGVHGVALAPDLGKGFVSDGAANTVTTFDLATLKPLARIAVGNKPDAIAYDAKTRRVFAVNGNSSDVTAINADDSSAIETLKLHGKPEFAVVDGSGHLYVNIESQTQLAVIDTQTLRVLATYNLGPKCIGPSGLAMDVRLRRLFAACSNKIMTVVQADTGSIIDTVAIGAHSDAAVFDPGTGLVFSSNGDGTLTVIGEAPDGHYQIFQTVPTVPSARTMALDPVTHRLYLAAAETDGVDPLSVNSPNLRMRFKPDSFMLLTVEPN
jgi:DNA-binding beta-propeller fold protein YncE